MATWHPSHRRTCPSRGATEWADCCARYVAPCRTHPAGLGLALNSRDVPWADVTRTPPTRDAAMAKLREAGKRPLDVLVVGGGATGCGVALDAATRGLNVGLVEQADFAAGTSSRSTKLVHGGVRYLEKAVFQVRAGVRTSAVTTPSSDSDRAVIVLARRQGSGKGSRRVFRGYIRSRAYDRALGHRQRHRFRPGAADPAGGPNQSGKGPRCLQSGYPLSLTQMLNLIVSLRRTSTS